MSLGKPGPLLAKGVGIFKGYRTWVALSGLLAAWFLSAPEHTLFNRRLSVWLLTLLYLVAALAFQQSARRPDLPSPFRRGLRWIAVGLALNAMGGAYVFLAAVADPGSNAAFNLGDLLFLSTYPVILAGLMCMPGAERASIGLGRLIVDSTVFVAGVGLPLWFFAVGPGLSAASGYGAALTVIYPLVTLSGITLLNIVLLTRIPLPSRFAFILLVTAISVSWLADLLYLLDSVRGFIARGPINWPNVFNTVSLGLSLWAAGRIATDKMAGTRTVQAAPSSPLPLMTIVVLSAWLLMFIVRGHPDPASLSRIFWILTLLFVLLAVREVFVFRDGARWLSAEVQRESRARFEALVRNSSDIIMVVDAQGFIQFASPAVAAALGVSADAILGRSLLDLALFDDAARGAEFLDHILKTPKAMHTLQWRLRHSDGTYRHFETVGRNAMNEPAVEGLVINLRDVTDRIALEGKLLQARKLEALGQLVGGIAHNFNNILTSTMMRLSLLRETRDLPADVAEELQSLDKDAKRTADLTKKLVQFGQQQFLSKGPLDLREAVARLQPEIVRLLGKNIQLYITGRPSPVSVEADAALIDLVILSLCSNARDAMDGGGSLIIEITNVDESSLAQAGGEHTGAFARLSVQDTGCGFDSLVRQRLFEPFFTTKGVGGGLGLGLAAAHGIVKQHGGWIDVESAPGKGSTFRVYLPSARPAAG